MDRMTTNGVRFTFDNNDISSLGDNPPLFEFEPDGSGMKLVAVNFDGYTITRKPNTGTPALVGDGIADDTQTIQAWLDNKEHGPLPVGIYRITAPVRISYPDEEQG